MHDDDKLDISGYKLVHSDHPSNSTRAGECIYHEEALVKNVNHLNEYIRLEIKIDEKLCSFNVIAWFN